MSSYEQGSAFERLAQLQFDQKVEVPTPTFISDTELWSLSQRGPAALLDVRDRREFFPLHNPRSRNISVEDLPLRVRHEVEQKEPVVIDCTYTRSVLCRFAATTLLHRGYQSVYILNHGRFIPPGCS